MAAVDTPSVCGNAHALGRVYERICEIVARAKKGVVKILPSVL